jgi:hypothetical protein
MTPDESGGVTMSDRPTDDQLQWVQAFTGLDVGGRGSDAATTQAQGENTLSSPPWRSPATKTIPTEGRYKDIENNSWGGLPEVLYPDTPDNFLALQAIDVAVDQMARIRFDAHTLMNETSGGRRLPHKVEWASFIAQKASGPNKMPTLKDLQAEYDRLRSDVLSNVGSISKPELKDFLSQTIHAVIPPLAATQALRRKDKLPPPEYLHEDRLIRYLLKHG